MIEPWILTKLEKIKNASPIILRDPQRMIRSGAWAVDGWAEQHGYTVLFCTGNLALREMVEHVRTDPSSRILLVDRSREDAKSLLFYPDLDALSAKNHKLNLSLRDFLVEQTGDFTWPHLVNDRNLQRNREDACKILCRSERRQPACSVPADPAGALAHGRGD